MTSPLDIRFYHLTKQPIEAALPKLVEKILEKGHKILVYGEDEAEIKAIDEALWSYEALSFLPHDKDGCKWPEKQPVFLTQEQENKNKATVLLLLNGAISDLMQEIPMTLMMFNGQDASVVDTCRTHWSQYKGQGAHLTYWQQNEMGGWDKKA